MQFIALITNDHEGARSMLSAGAFGAAWQREVVGRYGGTVLFQAGTIGAFDAVMILDLPSLAVARSFGLASAASGQRIELLVTLSEEEVEEASTRAAAVSEALDQLLSGVSNSETT